MWRGPMGLRHFFCPEMDGREYGVGVGSWSWAWGEPEGLDA